MRFPAGVGCVVIVVGQCALLLVLGALWWWLDVHMVTIITRFAAGVSAVCILVGADWTGRHDCVLIVSSLPSQISASRRVPESPPGDLRPRSHNNAKWPPRSNAVFNDVNFLLATNRRPQALRAGMAAIFLRSLNALPARARFDAEPCRYIRDASVANSVGRHLDLTRMCR